MAQPVALFKSREAGSRDWTNQELAEFYRVEAALTQAGLRIFSDRGQTDEGDPWFVFCRAPEGDVVIHFARIGRDYLIASDTFPETLRGQDFRQLINRFAGQNPTLMALPPSPSRSRLFVHPSALLAAIVATAFFWIQPQDAVAHAMDGDALEDNPSQVGDPGTEISTMSPDGLHGHPPLKLEGSEDHPQSRHMVLILSIMTMAATFDWVSDHAVLGLVDSGILKEAPLEDRFVADRRAPVLLTLDESDPPHVAFGDHGLANASQPQLDGEAPAFPAEWIKTASLVVAEGTRDPADVEWVMTGPAAKTSDTDLPLDGFGLPLQGDLSSPGPHLGPRGAPPEAGDLKDSPATKTQGSESDPVGDGPEAGFVSTALSFILREADALKLKLSVKALDDQQDLVVQSGYGLRDLVSRISEAFERIDQSGHQTVSFLQEIHRPIENKELDDPGAIEAEPERTSQIDLEGAKDIVPFPEIDDRIVPDLNSQLDRYDTRMEPLVQAFLTNSPTVELFMVDGNVVLLERNETRYGDEGFGVLSWALDDGSTLSLIGVLTDLPALG